MLSTKQPLTIFNKDILGKMRSGERFLLDNVQYSKIQAKVNCTTKLNPTLNNSENGELIGEKLNEIFGTEIDASTIVFVPFYTNFDLSTIIIKNVFINHDCTFLEDMAVINVEDNVIIGPKANLITKNHPLNSYDRESLTSNSVVIKRNDWIGAEATILNGATNNGENIVGAAAYDYVWICANLIILCTNGKISPIEESSFLSNPKKSIELSLPVIGNTLTQSLNVLHPRTDKKPDFVAIDKTSYFLPNPAYVKTLKDYQNCIENRLLLEKKWQIVDSEIHKLEGGSTNLKGAILDGLVIISLGFTTFYFKAKNELKPRWYLQFIPAVMLGAILEGTLSIVAYFGSDNAVKLAEVSKKREELLQLQEEIIALKAQ